VRPRRPTAAKPKKIPVEAPGSGETQDAAAQAARFGITLERVLEEYGHIAFVDLGRIATWDADGRLTMKPSSEIEPKDRAAISEIRRAGPGEGTVHIKLYDKKAALDAIGRHLGMFPLPPRRHDDETPPDPGEDPLEELERRLARLAARLAEDAAAAADEGGGPPGDQG
jgi:hypothetical protein